MKLSLSFTVLAWTTLLAETPLAAPTWPASIDELEDIMFLNSGYRKSGFADAVTPCSFSAAGPGRITAAEWLRTAFHDMATASIYFGGSGGIDASIMFETDRGENIGAAFNTSLAFFANFYSSRVSVSDLIALSVYISVRSCGGPIVPIRAGRIDATVAGQTGVPEPQNSEFTFEQQFLRTGFNKTEMIQMTACGHTVGGVHSADFPQIVPPGTVPNDFQAVDSTIAVFDERIAVEWVAGNTTDPMSVGPSIAAGRNSDAKVFGADGNVTMQALTNPATFRSTCASILQRMIEVVPPGTVFTDPIQPYEVKPSGLQLTLLSGGASILFTGNIRVRTTVRTVASVKLVYKDRNGGSTCGACTISTTAAGTTTGFDDSFAFYTFSATLPSDLSISSFNVLINPTSGATEIHDNNGVGFPVQDSIMLLKPQSCLSNTGNLTIVAAVRNTRSTMPVSLDLSLKVPRQGAIVPALAASSLTMVNGYSVGPYNTYSISYSLDPSQYTNTRFDVTSGSSSTKVADAFKSTADLLSSCAAPLNPGGTSSSSSSLITSKTSSTSTTTSSTTFKSSSISKSSSTTSTSSSTTAKSLTSLASSKTSSTSLSTSTKSSLTSSTTSTKTSLTSSSSSSSSISTTIKSSTSSAAPSQTAPANKAAVANYTYYGCQTDATNNRALSSSATTSATMSLEMCASFCIGFIYWGTEYGQECYCGNSLTASTSAPSTDCSFPCAGNNLEYCGAGNRLTVYKLNTTAEAAPAIKPTVGSYKYNGCKTDNVGMRALNASALSSDSMTLEYCATWCKGYTYWGTEYGRECYCGNSFNTGSVNASDTDCSFLCAADKLEYCGAGNRLSTYALA